jgi:hypothetical protein
LGAFFWGLSFGASLMARQKLSALRLPFAGFSLLAFCVQVFGFSGFQVFRFSGFQAFRLSGFLAFWLSGFLAFWLSGFLAFWLSGFQAFWLSGFQAFRLSGFLAFRLSGFPRLGLVFSVFPPLLFCFQAPCFHAFRFLAFILSLHF